MLFWISTPPPQPNPVVRTGPNTDGIGLGDAVKVSEGQGTLRVGAWPNPRPLLLVVL